MKNKNEVKEYKYFLATAPDTAEPIIFMQKEKSEPKRMIGYQNDLHTSRLGIFILLVWLIIGLIWIKNIDNGINYHEEPQTIQIQAVSSKIKGVISAYNLVEYQTDLDFCVGAYGDNLCQLLDQGVKIVANNCLPKNTEVEIDGLGRFVVLDKMNSRYGCDYFDIAMPGDKVIEAIQLGKQYHKVIIYK